METVSGYTVEDGPAERLVRSGLDALIVSLDGTTQDVYEVYRLTGHLERGAG